jgi:hypothetical protein
LAEVEGLERDYAALPKPTARLASPEERQRILALAQDLPTIWHASTTTCVERKQLLRFLIKDVTLTRREATIHIGIRWQTEALTELDIPRPKRSCPVKSTAPLQPLLTLSAGWPPLTPTDKSPKFSTIRNLPLVKALPSPKTLSIGSATSMTSPPAAH